MAEQPQKGIAPDIKEVGGFELLGKIGQGGMGSVFRARQKSLDRVVALKVLPPSIAKDAKFIERFQREARASAKLNHPNIVQGIDVGQDEATGLWYFAMELVEGPSLRTVLKEQVVLPEERVLRIAMDMARALDAAAQQGIVHRDIKPDNILLTDTGEAKLADLGLAKQINEDASLTQTGMALGTPFYMAPEQIRGQLDQIDQRTDIYALGGTLFHLVTGQKPFNGETGAVIMTKHLTEAPPRANKLNPQVSEAFSRLLSRMLQKKKEMRVQSAKELLVALEKIASGEEHVGTERNLRHTGGPRAPAPTRETTPPAKSNTTAVIAGVAAGIAILIVLAFLLLRGNSNTPETKVANVTPKPNIPAPVTPLPPSPPAHTGETPNVKPPSEPVKVTHTPVPKKKEDEPAAKPAPTPEPAPEEPPKPLTTPVEKPVSKPAEPAPVPLAEWPMADLVTAIRENTPEKAVERTRSGNYAAKDTMLDALKSLDSRRDARMAAIKNLVGQEVKVETVKESLSGKLTSFEDNRLKIETTFMIDGKALQATRTVALADLTPASVERLAPPSAPTTPVDWIAATLSAMAGKQYEAAEKALQNLEGHELHAPLAAELKRSRIQEREGQAQTAWTKLQAKADEPATKPKPFLDELTAFAKKFSDSDLIATPEVATKVTELKERFERQAMGLNPNVVKLFKGRVLNYDAKTQVITLGYDFTTKEQTEDFIDSTWAPPGDHTGLTWKKGELRTFCKGTADRILKMPQFMSGTLNIQFDFKRIDTSKRNRFEVEFAFYGLESEGKMPKVSYKATEKGYYLLGAKGELKSDDDQIPFRVDGNLELSCQGQAIVVKENGKAVLEYQLPKPNDHTGFWLGGGWDSGITFTKMQISGRLDPAWLAKALAAVKVK